MTLYTASCLNAGCPSTSSARTIAGERYGGGLAVMIHEAEWGWGGGGGGGPVGLEAWGVLFRRYQVAFRRPRCQPEKKKGVCVWSERNGGGQGPSERNFTVGRHGQRESVTSSCLSCRSMVFKSTASRIGIPPVCNIWISRERGKRGDRERERD